MSLTVALTVAQSGLQVAEKKLSVTSDNITNADQAGYTVKTYDANNISSNGVDIQVSGQITGYVNRTLSASLNQENSVYQKDSTVASYLTTYSDGMGTTDAGAVTLSSSMDTLLTNLQSLTSNPGDSSAQSAVVSSAQVLTSQVNQVSASIQTLRKQADGEVGTSVDTINQALSSIADLNVQIGRAASNGGGTADLEDQRTAALSTLSSQIGVQYYYDSSNQLNVYTGSGDALVSGNHANQLSYNTAGTVNSGTSFSPITLNGVDVGSKITSGKLGGLLELRDTTLPAEQSKIDNLATTMASDVNSVLNQGTSLPARNSITSSNTFASTDALSATGTMRIALVNSTGTVQSVNDVNLSSYSTIGALVSGLNSISGISASLDSSGHVVIASTDPTLGVATNEMNSSVGSANKGIADYLGLNNLFDGSDAKSLKVSDYLAQNSSALATGALSNSATLAAGDLGIASGDSSVIGNVTNLFTSNQSFTAAGGFGAQQSTFSGYANLIVSGAATQSSAATTASSNSQYSYNYLNTQLSNASGVNIDQETANMALIQNSYGASATLISTIREMFSQLLQAVAAR